MEEVYTTPPTSKSEKKSESPSPMDTTLLEELASGASAPSLLGDTKEGGSQAPPESEPEGEKAAPADPKRKPESPTPSQSKCQRTEASDADSSPTSADPEMTAIVRSTAQSGSELGVELEKEESEEEVEEEPPRKTPARKGKMPTKGDKGKKPMVTKIQGKEEAQFRQIVVPKTVDFETLEKLGIAVKVREKFKAIRWGKFLEWRGLVYEGMVREFYEDTEVKTDVEEGPVQLKFRLLDREHSLYINELNIALGMVDFRGVMTLEYKGALKVVPEFPQAQ